MPTATSVFFLAIVPINTDPVCKGGIHSFKALPRSDDIGIVLVGILFKAWLHGFQLDEIHATGGVGISRVRLTQGRREIEGRVGGLILILHGNVPHLALDVRDVLLIDFVVGEVRGLELTIGEAGQMIHLAQGDAGKGDAQVLDSTCFDGDLPLSIDGKHATLAQHFDFFREDRHALDADVVTLESEAAQGLHAFRDTDEELAFCFDEELEGVELGEILRLVTFARFHLCALEGNAFGEGEDLVGHLTCALPLMILLEGDLLFGGADHKLLSGAVFGQKPEFEVFVDLLRCRIASRVHEEELFGLAFVRADDLRP